MFGVSIIMKIPDSFPSVCVQPRKIHKNLHDRIHILRRHMFIGSVTGIVSSPQVRAGKPPETELRAIGAAADRP